MASYCVADCFGNSESPHLTPSVNGTDGTPMVALRHELFPPLSVTEMREANVADKDPVVVEFAVAFLVSGTFSFFSECYEC
ncbi:hypothetical protein PISMIDRAFT_681655, partial [Pisolithus microcarpus 441]